MIIKNTNTLIVHSGKQLYVNSIDDCYYCASGVYDELDCHCVKICYK